VQVTHLEKPGISRFWIEQPFPEKQEQVTYQLKMGLSFDQHWSK
jgi:hypothetical protein